MFKKKKTVSTQTLIGYNNIKELYAQHYLSKNLVRVEIISFNIIDKKQTKKKR